MRAPLGYRAVEVTRIARLVSPALPARSPRRAVTVSHPARVRNRVIPILRCAHKARSAAVPGFACVTTHDTTAPALPGASLLTAFHSLAFAGDINATVPGRKEAVVAPDADAAAFASAGAVTVMPVDSAIDVFGP